MRFTTSRGIAALFAFSCCLFAGCGKDKAIVERGDPKAVLGAWLEVRAAGEQPAGNPRRADLPKTWLTENLRKLEIKEDGTFALSLVTPAKAPVAGKTAEGSWSWTNGTMVFEVKNQTLGDKLTGIVPTRSGGIAVGVEPPTLVITDESGLSAKFNKAP